MASVILAKYRKLQRLHKEARLLLSMSRPDLHKVGGAFKAGRINEARVRALLGDAYDEKALTTMLRLWAKRD